MPRLSPAAALQLVLLLSAVPAQYYISRWCGSTTAQRYHATTRYAQLGKSPLSNVLNPVITGDNRTTSLNAL